MTTLSRTSKRIIRSGLIRIIDCIQTIMNTDDAYVIIGVNKKNDPLHNHHRKNFVTQNILVKFKYER